MTGGTKVDWHALSAKQALNNLESKISGLTPAAASARRKRAGLNILPRPQADGGFRIFFSQFKDPLIIVLIVAALISLALQEIVDASVIGAAVAVNTLIGFIQEYKANRALKKLNEYLQPYVRVRRGGRERRVLAEEIVPGDIVILSVGDKVSADLRLLETDDLEVSEAALTGESMPVSKNPDKLSAAVILAERANMAFAGTHVLAGRGVAVAVATGAHTQLGKIALMVKDAKEEATPLQIQMKRLAKWISAFVVFLTAVIFFLGLLYGFDWFLMFETSVALAVAAVPEGMVVTITIILALGAQKIFRRRSLVRRLVAAETLGSVSVICSDKTGTITEGLMKVDEIMPLAGTQKADQISHLAEASEIILILEAVMLCNDASVSGSRKLEKQEVLGTPTEKALMEAGLSAGIEYPALAARHLRLAAAPFDSAKKYMATLNQWAGGPRLLIKGAPETVIDFSAAYWQNNEERRLSSAKRKELRKIAADMAKRGLRVLSVAYRQEPSGQTIIPAGSPDNLVFLGFLGLRDPLRPEAREQIAKARAAGVKTVIITGDHPNTALAIAREAGLIVKDAHLATGAQIDKWSDKELKARTKQILVYARAEPRHKIRIVRAWQAHGQVVAMTGDGVNDAPALKAADIGVALGSGTEVAKEAADLVLLDNNLGTITAAIEEGRIIFDNIRKSSVYLLTGSFTEIVLIAGAIVLGLPLPLLATQILWINMFADSLPAIALAKEPGGEEIMRLPPRRRSEPVLNREMLAYVFGVGLLTDVSLLALFIWYLAHVGDAAQAQTLMFAGVGLGTLIYVFSFKNFRRSIFRTNPFSNLWLIAAVAAGTGLMLLSLLHPFFQMIFKVAPLNLSDWIILLMIGGARLILIEAAKEWFIHKKGFAAGK